ncbi:MAG: hypothetical protein HY314_06535 [Acidobacteria bacterium]|nr:hypothetical protein [Acidobacteriota bacterium]
METVIFRKVLDYLTDYVGELTTPGTPVLDAATGHWRVPVLCKTAKGILPVGAFLLDEAGHFVAVPDKEQMVRVLETQLTRLPFLVFGEKEELEKKGVQVVSV